MQKKFLMSRFIELAMYAPSHVVFLTASARIPESGCRPDRLFRSSASEKVENEGGGGGGRRC